MASVRRPCNLAGPSVRGSRTVRLALPMKRVLSVSHGVWGNGRQTMTIQPQPGFGEPARAHQGPAGPEADRERRFAVDPTEATPRMRHLDPRVRVVWWISGLVGLVLMSLPVLVFDFLIPVDLLPTGSFTCAYYLIGLLLVGVVPVIRYHRWRYALRPNDLWIRRGVLSISVSVIPYRRLQFVDTTAGPRDRAFGLASLVVHTAAIGAAGRVPGLDKAEAEQLRETLAALEPDDALV